MDIDFNKIYEELVTNGFYDNIKLKICNSIKPNRSINIPAKCKSRLNAITQYKSIDNFIFYYRQTHSPKIGNGFADFFFTGDIVY